MEPRVILYQYKDEGISVIVEAFFYEGALVVEGYDIGKRVEEYWGDSDYEYKTTVDNEHLHELVSALSVSGKEELLAAIGSRFTGNHAYSAFQSFLDLMKVPYSAFSWT